MPSKSFKESLKSLVRVKARTSEAHRAKLEADLLVRHQDLYSKGTPGSAFLRFPRWWQRPAWTVLLIFGLALGAAAIPTSTSLAVGLLLAWEVSDGSIGPGIRRRLLDDLQQAETAEQVSVSISQSSDSGTRLLIILFGNRLPAEEIVPALGNRFPSLASSTPRVEVLSGAIRTSLIRRVGQAFSLIQIDEGDIQAARSTVLERLAAEGLAGAEVEIVPGRSGREIQIELPSRPKP